MFLVLIAHLYLVICAGRLSPPLMSVIYLHITQEKGLGLPSIIITNLHVNKIKLLCPYNILPANLPPTNFISFMAKMWNAENKWVEYLPCVKAI